MIGLNFNFTVKSGPMVEYSMMNILYVLVKVRHIAVMLWEKYRRSRF
jgi:hypothetical protein